MIAPEDLAAAFGRACKGLRSAAGLSQERAAEIAGLSTATVSRHELGERSMSLEVAARLARALGSGLAEVAATIDAPASLGAEQLAALAQLRRLDAARLNVATLVLRALAELP